MTAAAPIPIVDADSHVMEPPDLWTSRMSSEKWGDLVPHVARHPKSGIDTWYIGERRASAVAKFAHGGWNEFPPAFPPTVPEVDPAAYDPHARLQRMDEYGISSQLLYPNLLGFSSIVFLDLEPQLRLECVQTYNDFLVDFASADNSRLIPLMWLPFWDVEASIAEMERAEKRGHHGIIMPSNFEPVKLPLLYEEHWYPIWEAAQSLELSVNFHTGFQVSVEDARQVIGQKASRADYAKGSTMFIMGNVRTITDLTLYGVCHRFPRLNFVSVEGGFGWMPYLGQLLDWQWLNSGARKAYPEMKLMPSEYLKRQVHGTFWFETIPAALLEGFEHNALFSSDFPHPTSLSPGPASYADTPDTTAARTLAGLPDDLRAMVLHDNAARVYHVR